jgi:hypothetical protein
VEFEWVRELSWLFFIEKNTTFDGHKIYIKNMRQQQQPTTTTKKFIRNFCVCSFWSLAAATQEPDVFLWKIFLISHDSKSSSTKKKIPINIYKNYLISRKVSLIFIFEFDRKLINENKVEKFQVNFREENTLNTICFKIK